MRKNQKHNISKGVIGIFAFVFWTALIQRIDVKTVGPNGSSVGFATFNVWFHKLTGVHMAIYTITDWLGLVPIFVCMGFGILGLTQLIQRRSLCKVDLDIILLGIYYSAVIFAYLIFEMVPINYRPVLINGFLEASYPSSTTLLVLSVMPTFTYQIYRRVKKESICKMCWLAERTFTLFMVAGRTWSGVHWFTDIAGAIFISLGLYYSYIASVEKFSRRQNDGI